MVTINENYKATGKIMYRVVQSRTSELVQSRTSELAVCAITLRDWTHWVDFEEGISTLLHDVWYSSIAWDLKSRTLKHDKNYMYTSGYGKVRSVIRNGAEGFSAHVGEHTPTCKPPLHTSVHCPPL